MENSKSKKGLASKSTKSLVSSDMGGDNESASLFKLSSAIKKELSAQGLVWRFIFVKKYIDNHGFHRSGWKPHQFAKPAEDRGKFDFGDGIDSEGYLRRGDQILAVKTKEAQAIHRAKIQRRNDAHKQYNKQAAQNLRTSADVKVFEGYEDQTGDTAMGDESDS